MQARIFIYFPSCPLTATIHRKQKLRARRRHSSPFSRRLLRPSTVGAVSSRLIAVSFVASLVSSRSSSRSFPRLSSQSFSHPFSRSSSLARRLSIAVSLGPSLPTPSPLDKSSSPTRPTDLDPSLAHPSRPIGAGWTPGRRSRRDGRWTIGAAGPSSTTAPPSRNTDSPPITSWAGGSSRGNALSPPGLVSLARGLPRRIPRGRNVRSGLDLPTGATAGRLVRPPRQARPRTRRDLEAHPSVSFVSSLVSSARFLHSFSRSPSRPPSLAHRLARPRVTKATPAR
ncbi:hypothetical protein FRC08_009832 [Ceratobasidium sp. 394]|nr:hypothetical protein FRC08_009832 [Ceratobasidium sp. 394]